MTASKVGCPAWGLGERFTASYLLTPCCRVLLEKLTGLQLVKKFPAFHGTWRFITALTSVCHLSLSWARPIQSIYQHPTSWRSILILSTHLRLGLPSGLFPSGFPTKTPIHPHLLTHTRHMPNPSHSSRFYHPHNIGWGVQGLQLLTIKNQYTTKCYKQTKEVSACKGLCSVEFIVYNWYLRIPLLVGWLCLFVCLSEFVICMCSLCLHYDRDIFTKMFLCHHIPQCELRLSIHAFVLNFDTFLQKCGPYLK